MVEVMAEVTEVMVEVTVSLQIRVIAEKKIF